MGVKYNRTKFERETRRWWPGQHTRVADLTFKSCISGPKAVIFGPKKPFEHIQTCQTKGNGGYTPRAA